MDSWRTKFTASGASNGMSASSVTWLYDNECTWAVVKYGGYFLVYKLVGQALVVMLVRKFSIIKDIVKTLSELAGPLAWLLPWNSDILRVSETRAQNDLAERRVELDIRKHEVDEQLRAEKLNYEFWKATEELELRKRQMDAASSNDARKILIELAKMGENRHFQERRDLESQARLMHNMSVEARRLLQSHEELDWKKQVEADRLQDKKQSDADKIQMEVDRLLDKKQSDAEKMRDKKYQDAIKNQLDAERLKNDQVRAQVELERFEHQKKVAEEKAALENQKADQLNQHHTERMTLDTERLVHQTQVDCRRDMLNDKRFEQEMLLASARQQTEQRKADVAEIRCDLEKLKTDAELGKNKRQSASHAMRISNLHAAKMASIQLGLVEVLGSVGVDVEMEQVLESAEQFTKVLLGEQHASDSVVVTDFGLTTDVFGHEVAIVNGVTSCLVLIKDEKSNAVDWIAGSNVVNGFSALSTADAKNVVSVFANTTSSVVLNTTKHMWM